MTAPASTCILCRSSAVPFLVCPDFLTSTGSFSIVRCTACGFLWTADAPAPEQIHPYYGGVYEERSHPPLAHPLLRRMRTALQTRLRARMVEREAGKQRGKVLDIGCGDGSFLLAMRNRGWQPTGVELAEQKRAALKALGVTAVGPEEWPNFV